ncbi:MAG TPA: carboxylating nicotinate-nucleotide diphosphorylase [Pirellula sp.]|nr:carboxylating nicotinate-nucleotide diphosphorylase [Pirellula sp.]
MHADYHSQTIDVALLDDLSHLVRLAIREDLDRTADLTTLAIVPQGIRGAAVILPRVPGVAAGVDLIEAMLQEFDAQITRTQHVGYGERFEANQPLATLAGETRDLLTCERTILNFLGRLCGISTLTSRYVAKLSGTNARVYDTRKTTPGWRRLEKYAVRCGGGRNHRLGLFDGILIKDNHLACRASKDGKLLDPGTAVQLAKSFVAGGAYRFDHPPLIEIEVDRLSQLESALSALPDIVLLDNMSCDKLNECVSLRDRIAPSVQLEASGGINLGNIGNIAMTGVDRISVGALTHSAISLDLGLDWILNNE